MSRRLLIHASRKGAEGLPVGLFVLFVITLLFVSFAYVVDRRLSIESLLHTRLLTIVTMTIVGYRDVSPETLALARSPSEVHADTQRGNARGSGWAP